MVVTIALLPIRTLAIQAAFPAQQQWPLQADISDMPSSVPPTSTNMITELPAKPVQSWYAGQMLSGCDKTACASCRWYYMCDTPLPVVSRRQRRPDIIETNTCQRSV